MANPKTQDMIDHFAMLTDIVKLSFAALIISIMAFAVFLTLTGEPKADPAMPHTVSHDSSQTQTTTH